MILLRPGFLQFMEKFFKKIHSLTLMAQSLSEVQKIHFGFYRPG